MRLNPGPVVKYLSIAVKYLSITGKLPSRYFSLPICKTQLIIPANGNNIYCGVKTNNYSTTVINIVFDSLQPQKGSDFIINTPRDPSICREEVDWLMFL